MISFSDALANNRRLRVLELWPVQNRVTLTYHAAFAHVFPNNSSILSTCHSNHTLEKLCSESNEEVLQEGLRSLLQLNRVYCESQAARLKIIKMLFSGRDSNTQLFVDMNLSVRLHVAWMARDDNGSTQIV